MFSSYSTAESTRHGDGWWFRRLPQGFILSGCGLGKSYLLLKSRDETNAPKGHSIDKAWPNTSSPERESGVGLTYRIPRTSVCGSQTGRVLSYQSEQPPFASSSSWLWRASGRRYRPFNYCWTAVPGHRIEDTIRLGAHHHLEAKCGIIFVYLAPVSSTSRVNFS